MVTLESFKKFLIIKPSSKIEHILHNPIFKIDQSIKDEWYLFALKDINIGDEIVCDYNNTPNFMRKPKKEWKC
jgi:hypothetical protein